MEKKYLKRALIGLALVVFALAIAMVDSSPRLESSKNMTLTLNIYTKKEINLGTSENEIRLVVKNSNSTQTLVFLNTENNARYSVVSEKGHELWIPSGGSYYVTCSTCNNISVNVRIGAEIYKIGGSFIVLISALVIGLVGGIYAMMSIVAHFMELGLRKRTGGEV